MLIAIITIFGMFSIELLLLQWLRPWVTIPLKLTVIFSNNLRSYRFIFGMSKLCYSLKFHNYYNVYIHSWQWGKTPTLFYFTNITPTFFFFFFNGTFLIENSWPLSLNSITYTFVYLHVLLVPYMQSYVYWTKTFSKTFYISTHCDFNHQWVSCSRGVGTNLEVVRRGRGCDPQRGSKGRSPWWGPAVFKNLNHNLYSKLIWDYYKMGCVILTRKLFNLPIRQSWRCISTVLYLINAPPLINAPLTYFQIKLGKMPKFLYSVSL